jgi:hypothetical protein
MKAKRKAKSILHLLSIVWGLVYSVLMFLFVGLEIIVGFFGDGPRTLMESPKSFVTWDDPGPYFLIYITGYAVIWWKPLWGSIIIMAASIYYVIIAGVDGPPYLAAPGFLVGALYMAYWLIKGRKKTNDA